MMKACLCSAGYERECSGPGSPGRRAFLASAVGAGVAGAIAPSVSVAAAPSSPGKREFMQEATRLAIESVEKGWGGPFGAP
jgi:hypothetical protein